MPNRLPARELLSRMVAIDTTSRIGTRPLAELVCDYLDRPGVRIDSIRGESDRKVSLQIALGPTVDPRRRSGLVLCGHLDAVPVEPAGWESDPFRLQIRDDRWFGRGTCDMKGFLALAVAAAGALEPDDLRHPLVLLLTCDEELGALGAQQVVATANEREPLPRATVIGEPTSLQAVRMHKGSVRLRLVVRGVSAHAGLPHRGQNAVVAAARAIGALDEVARVWAAERPAAGSFFADAPYVPLNVGTIRGGNAVNVVPERCDVLLGLRPLPGMRTERLVKALREALGRTLSTGEWELETVNEIQPLETAATAPIYRQLCDLLGQRTDLGVSFASDAGPLQSLGLDCVLFGPGSMADAHCPNEFVRGSEVAAADKVIAGLVRANCRHGKAA